LLHVIALLPLQVFEIPGRREWIPEAVFTNIPTPSAKIATPTIRLGSLTT
jgi:hypothetical protein